MHNNNIFYALSTHSDLYAIHLTHVDIKGLVQRVNPGTAGDPRILGLTSNQNFMQFYTFVKGIATWEVKDAGASL